MNARLEIGEVSLTATIGEVFGQFLGAVVTRDASARYQVGELITRNRGQLCGPAQ
jgi:hypothetical protein